MVLCYCFIEIVLIMRYFVLVILLFGLSVSYAQVGRVLVVDGSVSFQKKNRQILPLDLINKDDVIVLQANSYVGLIDSQGKHYEFHGPDTVPIRNLLFSGKKKFRPELSSLHYLYEKRWFGPAIFDRSPTALFFFPNPYQKKIIFPIDSILCVRWIRINSDSTRLTLEFGDSKKEFIYYENQLMIDFNDFRSQSTNFLFSLNGSKSIKGGFFFMDDVFYVEPTSSNIAASYNQCYSNSALENVIIAYFLEYNNFDDLAFEYYKYAYDLAPNIEGYKIILNNFLERKKGAK
jgi:hypothetical protein